MANPFDQFDSLERNPFDQFDQPEKAPSSLRRVADVGISALKGTIGVSEAAMGLADLVTGGYAGKAAEDIGFRPKEAKAILDEYLSPQQRAANKALADTNGFFPTIGTAIQNPSTILQSAVESLPLMGGGGVVARGLMKAANASPWVAGAIGEGLASAGQNTEQVRQETPGGLITPTQAASQIASGIGTGALSLAGAGLARKLKIADIDTMIAQGSLRAPVGASGKGFARRLAEGAVSEGVFEELPQSLQEQMWQNYALGKPITEGVPEAGAMGMLTGAVMGGPAAAISGNSPELSPRDKLLNDTAEAVIRKSRAEAQLSKGTQNDQQNQHPAASQKPAEAAPAAGQEAAAAGEAVLGELNATPIRENQGLAPESGQIAQGGEADRSGDLQQAPAAGGITDGAELRAADEAQRGAAGAIIPATPEEAKVLTDEHLAAARNLTRSEETRQIIDAEVARRQNPEAQNRPPVAESQVPATSEPGDAGLAPGQAAVLPEVPRGTVATPPQQAQAAAPAAIAPEVAPEVQPTAEAPKRAVSTTTPQPQPIEGKGKPTAPSRTAPGTGAGNQIAEPAGVGVEVERFQGNYKQGMAERVAVQQQKRLAAEKPDLTWTVEKTTAPKFPDRFDVVARRVPRGQQAPSIAKPENAGSAPAKQAELDRQADEKAAKPLTDKQKAAYARLQKKGLARKIIDQNKDTLLEAIAKKGGILLSERPDILGEKTGNHRVAFVGSVFSSKGIGIDDMATSLAQDYYLSPQEMEDGGVDALREKIRDDMDRAMAGTPQVHFSAVREQLSMETQLRQHQERQEDQALAGELEQAASGENLVFDADPSDLEAVDLPVSPQNLVDEELYANALEQLGEAEIERLSIQHDNDGDFRAAVLQLTKEKQNAGQRKSQETVAGGKNVAGATPEARPELKLAAQTEADLAAKAAAEQAAIDAKKATEAKIARDERNAANKAEKDRRAAQIIAEDKARREAEVKALQNPEDFVFGQNAPAAPPPVIKRVNTEQARGQGDIFSAKPAEPSPIAAAVTALQGAVNDLAKAVNPEAKPAQEPAAAKEPTEAKKSGPAAFSRSNDERQPFLKGLFGPREREQAPTPKLEPTPQPGQSIKAAPSVDMVRMAKLLGPQLYGNMSDIGPTTIKELFQNSFDALKGAIKLGQRTEGNIGIELDPIKRTITITDNGTGMTPATINKAFLTLAGTSKETDRASGGLGIAKMLFLFGNESLELRTVRDGVESRLKTSGEQLMKAFSDSSKAPDIRTRRTNDPSGTTVTVKIPETYRNEETDARESVKFPSDWEARDMLRQSPLLENIEVTLDGQTQPIGKHFPAEEYTLLTVARFPWGKARVMVAPAESPPYRNVSVLSNGLFQFEGKIAKDPGEVFSPSAPYHFFVNIEPDVKADSPNYPIALNRKGFSQSAAKDFEILKEYLGVLYANKTDQAGAQGFGSLRQVSVDGKIITEVNLQIPPAKKGSILSIDKNDKVEVHEGRLYVNNREVPELTREKLKEMRRDPSQFRVDQQLLDPEHLIVHDNVLTAGKPYLEDARAALGAEPVDSYIRGIGNVLKELRDAAGEPLVGGENYKEIGKVPVGVSVDTEYYGVNTAIPFKAIMVNPALVRGQDIATAPAVMVGTMIHELAHHAERNHSETGFIPELARLSVNMAMSGDTQRAVAKLRDVINNHSKVFDYFKDKEKNGSLTNRGIRLAGDADIQPSKGISGQPLGERGAGGDAEGRAGLRERTEAGREDRVAGEERARPSPIDGKNYSEVKRFLDEHSGSLPASQIESALAPAIDKLKIETTVWNTVEQAKAATGVDIPANATAMYAQDQVHVFAENITDELDAERGFWHEVSHAGLNHLYGIGSQEYERALTAVAFKNPKVRSNAVIWREKYGKDALQRAKDYGMTDEQVKRYVTLQSFDEALADLSGANVKINGLDKFLAAVQKFLRSIGLNRLADAMEGKTDAEALTLIAQARDAVIREGAHIAIGEPAQAFSRQDQTQTPEFKKWFGDSKVVDAEGRPLIEIFNPHKSDDPFWFGVKGGWRIHDKENRWAQFDKKGNLLKTGAGGLAPSVEQLKVWVSTVTRVMKSEISDLPNNIFIRFGDMPKGGRSLDYSTGRREAGISVYGAKKDFINDGVWFSGSGLPSAAVFRSAEGAPVYLVKGRVVGRGVDGEPVIKNAEIIGRLELAKNGSDAFVLQSAIGNRGTFDATNPDIRFSMGAYADTIKTVANAKPIQHVADAILSGDRVVSMWSRTVGTMYHLAEQLEKAGKPLFKQVFNKGQDFLNDIASFAVQSESLAPTLFHRNRGFKDFFKGPISPKNMKQVSLALYEGTLFGGGNPLEGRIWTDEELKGQAPPNEGAADMFRANPLTDLQIKLYREALAAGSDSVRTFAKAVIWKNADNLDIFADREMSLEDMAEDLRQRTDDAITDITAELEFANEHHAEEMAEMAEELEGDPKIKQKIAKAEVEFAEWVEKQEARVSALEGLKESTTKAEEKALGLEEHGYFPLKRFGDHKIEAWDAEGEKQVMWFAEGKPLIPKSGQAEAYAIAAALRAEHPDWTVKTGIVDTSKFKLFQGLNMDALELFAEHMDAKDTAAYQEFLKVGIADRSALKRMIHRIGMPGFSTDAGRTLASLIVSNSRYASTLYNLGEMRKLANQIEEGDIAKQATDLVEYLSKPNDEATKLRSFLFFNFLGGSIASAVVNLTQVPTMTVPYLAKDAKNLVKTLAGAAKLAFLKPENLQGPLKDAMLQAEKEGLTSPQELYQLMATASGNVFGSGHQVTMALKAWGSFFSAAEQFNRKTTFIAAYQVANENGIHGAAAYAYAKKAVIETQGLYNKGNRPVFSRGAIGATVMTFKQFSVMYIELLKRLPMKQRLMMMGLLMLAAGAEGLPFSEDIEDLIDTLGQWMGYNTQSKRAIRKAVTGALGEGLGNFVMKGISSVLPIDIQARMGMHNLIPGTGILKQSAVDKGRDARDFLGPVGGLLGNASDALEAMAIGRFDQAAMKALPLALQNVAKGGTALASGEFKDERGRKVMEAEPGEAIAKMIGFNPKRMADLSQVKRELQQDKNLLRIRETEIVDLWSRGIAGQDKEMVQEARDMLRTWNADNPEYRIVIKLQQIAKRVREMKTSGEARFLKSLPKEQRQRAREELTR